MSLSLQLVFCGYSGKLFITFITALNLMNRFIAVIHATALETALSSCKHATKIVICKRSVIFAIAVAYKRKNLPEVMSNLQV